MPSDPALLAHRVAPRRPEPPFHTRRCEANHHADCPGYQSVRLPEPPPATTSPGAYRAYHHWCACPCHPMRAGLHAP